MSGCWTDKLLRSQNPDDSSCFSLNDNETEAVLVLLLAQGLFSVANAFALGLRPAF